MSQPDRITESQISAPAWTKQSYDSTESRTAADATIEPSQIRLSSTSAGPKPSPARTNRAGG